MLRVGQQAVLEGHLKNQLGFRKSRAQVQLAIVESASARGRGRKARRDTEFILQDGSQAPAAQNSVPERIGKLLGGDVETVDVVVRVIKEVTHSFEGAGFGGGVRGGVDKPGHELGEAPAEIGKSSLRCLGEELAQLGERTQVTVPGEVGGINTEALSQLHEDGDGEGALVILQLIEIAGG